MATVKFVLQIVAMVALMLCNLDLAMSARGVEALVIAIAGIILAL